jgi:DNA-directed RNA polymerase subunit M/transcription elongation factor TFIIS
MSDGELVTIATFRSLGEAHIAKGALESEGIECTLTDENIAGIYSPAIGGIRLQVHSDDAGKAVEILPPDEPPLADEPPQDQKACPKCGSAEIHFVEKTLFSIDPAHWECDQCRARWVVEPDEPL